MAVLDGGSPAPDSQQIEDGDKVAEPITPSKEGYIFDGWYTAEDQKWDFDDPASSTMSLKAKWKKLINISFDTDGGSENPASQLLEEGQTVQEPVNPTKEGYIFGGWYDGSSEWDFTSSPSEDKTLKAKWLSQNSVSFDANGGSPTPESQTVPEGGKVAEPASPTREGYVFKGWYNGDDKWDFNDPASPGLVLIAKWDEVHNVSFDPDGGSPAPESLKVVNGQPATEASAPTKDGYNFLGWYTEGDSKWDFSNPITSDMTLKAKWTLYIAPPVFEQYTVSFDANGGSNEPNDQFISSGDKATRPGDPKRSGYYFEGWYKGDEKWDFNTILTEDINLTAKWKALNNVRFNSRGGSYTPSSQNLYEGEEVVQPDPPTKRGYSFQGWMTEENSLWDFDSLPESDMVLSASWKKDPAGEGSDQGEDEGEDSPTAGTKKPDYSPIGQAGEEGGQDFKKAEASIKEQAPKTGDPWTKNLTYFWLGLLAVVGVLVFHKRKEE